MVTQCASVPWLCRVGLDLPCVVAWCMGGAAMRGCCSLTVVRVCHLGGHPQALTGLFGEYVDGLNSESLKLSVWSGTVELDNLRIKPEALDKLELPFAVSGSIGNLSVSVPWTSLHKTPVEVHVRDVFLLVDKSAQTSREAMRRALSAKRRALAAAAQMQARRCVICHVAVPAMPDAGVMGHLSPLQVLGRQRRRRW